MCGIAGIYDLRGRPVAASEVRAMNDVIHHRGPDDGGEYVEHALGLANRRLSIIDLSRAGHQPMANEDGSIDLPFDRETGRLIDGVWERWLAWDPVRMVDSHAEALRGLRAIYIDSGKRDQYFLDLGAEGFRRALERIGVTDVLFELFDGTHMSIEYRYPIALRYLAERLTD